jgi:hypothetical protein
MGVFIIRVEHCPDHEPFLTKGLGSQRSSNEEHLMIKTIALIGLAAALALPSAPAFAVSGNSSSYGSEGYGPSVPTQSLTPFQRSWNHANESKERARAGAAWIRHHGGYGHRHLTRNP